MPAFYKSAPSFPRHSLLHIRLLDVKKFLTYTAHNAYITVFRRNDKVSPRYEDSIRCGDPAYYRWPARDGLGCFPKFPERTCLFHLFNSHRYLTAHLLAKPIALAAIDNCRIELLQPAAMGWIPGKLGRSASRTCVGSSAASGASCSSGSGRSSAGTATPRRRHYLSSTGEAVATY